MHYFLCNGLGDSIESPTPAEMQAFMNGVDFSDEEHGAVWLSDEFDNVLEYNGNGVLAFTPEANSRHLTGISRERAIDLWIKLVNGLLVDCPVPKCDKGQVRCPRPCLKLTDPGWFTKDGKKWRRFPEKGGFFEVSEGHAGEIVVTDKEGRKSTVPCPLCGGKTTVDCAVCHGAGKVPCPTCSKNDAAPKCPDCDKGLQICKTCEGAGISKR